MSVPPSPILRAAARWMDQLRHSDIRKARALFMSHNAFIDLTPSQYAAGLSWLEASGLVDDWHAMPLDRPMKIALFAAAIADAFWLEDAAILVPNASELPNDAERAADALGLSADDAFVVLHDVSGKIDLAERSRIGLGGELALLGFLQRETEADVRHVALFSDGYGFDISVEAGSFAGHLEVKSTTRRGRLTLYLSRHEFETMKRDVDWHLVAVRLDDDLQLRSIATVSREWINGAVPLDRSAHGRWESTRLDIPSESLVSGLPMIPASARTSQTGAFGGLPRWPG